MLKKIDKVKFIYAVNAYLRKELNAEEAGAYVGLSSGGFMKRMKRYLEDTSDESGFGNAFEVIRENGQKDGIKRITDLR